MNPSSASLDPIELAREADFVLGHLDVRPSLCQVEFDGRTQHLEPRVMQVLVALAAAEGTVLSRDMLIARCWSGRIVGEDAINRILGKLRVLARSARGAFRIETVPRVGYVLRLSTDVAGPTPRTAARPWSRPMSFPVLIGLTMAGLAVAAVVAWRAQAPPAWVVGDYELVAGDPGTEGWPDLSPDGRFLIYTLSAEGAPADIWFRAVSGGDPVRLVGGPDIKTAPVWSPTGDRIAYVRVAPGYSVTAEPCRIYVKPVPDGLERLVGRCLASPWTHRLDWSADGAALIFTEPLEIARVGLRVRRLDLRTGAVSDMTRPPTTMVGDLNATLSPDGGTLAFVRYTADQVGDVYTQTLDDGRLTRITRDGKPAWIDWSPDGRSLFVASSRSGPSELWSFDARGRREPQRLLVGLQDVHRPSAAAGMVAFQTVSATQEIVRVSDGVETVVVSGSLYESIDVSAAGVVAFIAWDQAPELWLQHPGEDAHSLRDLALTWPRDLAFSPDGGRLSLIADGQADSDVFLIDTQSGALRRLRSPGVQVSRATWTPDGRALVRSGFGGRAAGIARLDGVSEANATLLAGPEWEKAQVSPDGLFASRRGQAGVWRIEPGRPPRRVAPMRRPGQMWRVARGAVYVLDGQEADPHAMADQRRLLRHPLAGGSAIEVASGRIDRFAVDPRNGDLLLVRTLQDRRDIGLLRVARP